MLIEYCPISLTTLISQGGSGTMAVLTTMMMVIVELEFMKSETHPHAVRVQTNGTVGWKHLRRSR